MWELIIGERQRATGAQQGGDIAARITVPDGGGIGRRVIIYYDEDPNDFPAVLQDVLAGNLFISL